MHILTWVLKTFCPWLYFKRTLEAGHLGFYRGLEGGRSVGNLYLLTSKDFCQQPTHL